MDTDQELLSRLYPALNEITEANSGRKIVVVGHGDAWATLIRDTGIVDDSEAPRLENTAQVHFVYERGRTPTVAGRILEVSRMQGIVSNALA